MAGRGTVPHAFLYAHHMYPEGRSAAFSSVDSQVLSPELLEHITKVTTPEQHPGQHCALLPLLERHRPLALLQCPLHTAPNTAVPPTALLPPLR